MGTKNIVKYTERRGPVSISVEVETPVGVGDTLKFYTADVVPGMCERICSTLPVKVQFKNAKAMCEAFLIEDTDTCHGYGFLGNNCVLVPPYMIGRVEAITVDRNESARHIDVEFRPLYVIGFDVEYNDGEIPKHYCVSTFLGFGFEKVPYKANSMRSFTEYKAWLERRREEAAAQREKWLKENPCPM